MSSSQAPAATNEEVLEANRESAASPTRRRHPYGAALLLRALGLARGPAGSFLLGGDPEIDMGILASPDAVGSAVVHSGTRTAMNSTGARGTTVSISSMFVPFVNLGVICVGLLIETAQLEPDGRGLRPDPIRNEAMSRYALNTETGEMLRVRTSVRPAMVVLLQWTGLPIGDFVRERITFECDRRLFAAGRLEDSVLRFQRSTRIGGAACAGLKPSGPRDMSHCADNLAHNAGFLHEYVGGVPSLQENLRRVEDDAASERYGLLVAAVQGHVTIAGTEPTGGKTADLHAVAVGLGAERVKLAKAQRTRQENLTLDDASRNAGASGGNNRQALLGSPSEVGHQQHDTVLEDGMGGKLDLNELEFAASDLTNSLDQYMPWSPYSPHAASPKDAATTPCGPRALPKDVATSAELTVTPSHFQASPVSACLPKASTVRFPPSAGRSVTERAAITLARANARARPQDLTGTKQPAYAIGDFVEDGCVSHVTEPLSPGTAQRQQAAAAAQYALVNNVIGLAGGDHLNQLTHEGDDCGDGSPDDDEEVDGAKQRDESAERAWQAEQIQQAAAMATAELVDRERQEQADASTLKRKMARREYNIAAAKRSNQRRREAYENLVNGLKDAHARANELRERESELRATNIELRRRVRQQQTPK